MDQLEKIPNATVNYFIDEVLGGEQYVVKFPNGYGASIVRNGMSYGGGAGFWELAVLHGEGYAPKHYSDEDELWPLCYATPITNDVIGWLTPEKISDLVTQISILPPNPNCNHDTERDWFDYDLEEENEDAGLVH